MRPVQFRVRDSQPDRLFFTVRVYDSRAEMHEAFRRQVGEDDGDSGRFRWEGLVHGYEKIRIGADGSENLSPDCGVVYLHRGSLGAPTVAHEVIHMAARFWQRRHASDLLRLGCSMRREEEFAYIVSDLTDVLTERFWDLGLWRARRRKVA